MGDVRPLPLTDLDDDAFFSDLGSDEPYIRDNNSAPNGQRQLVFNTAGDDSRQQVGNRINPFTDRDLRALNVSQNQASAGSTTSGTRTPAITSPNEDHCHIMHDHELDNTVRNQLISVAVFCALFMAGEGVGGYLAHSLAIATDVLHLFSDLLSFFISLVAIYLARKPPTYRMTWGFYRAEILGAILSVFIIWVVTAILVYLAVDRLIHQNYSINPKDMLITASCGVAFNIIMAIILHVETFKCRVPHGHSHAGGGHGHSHSMTPKRRQGDQEMLTDNVDDEEIEPTLSAGSTTISREKNIVIRAAFVHVLGDLLQSVGVLVAAIIIMVMGEKANAADPICTFIFSILVLITTFTVIRDSFFILMEGSPKKVSYVQLYRSLSDISGVRHVHSLKIWSLTSNEVNASVHLAVDDGIDSFTVLRAANKVFRSAGDPDLIARTTIQVEPYNEAIMTTCQQCLLPPPPLPFT